MTAVRDDAPPTPCEDCHTEVEPPAPATPCEVCHAEVERGFKRTEHAALGHNCATCHGRSAKHSWSEDGHVKPDRPLKERAQVDKLCVSCHRTPKHPVKLDTDAKCSTCHRPHPKKQTADPDAMP